VAPLSWSSWLLFRGPRGPSFVVLVPFVAIVSVAFVAPSFVILRDPRGLRGSSFVVLVPFVAPCRRDGARPRLGLESPLDARAGELLGVHQ
jgi:hypothetical protein